MENNGSPPRTQLGTWVHQRLYEESWTRCRGGKDLPHGNVGKNQYQKPISNFYSSVREQPNRKMVKDPNFNNRRKIRTESKCTKDVRPH